MKYYNVEFKESYNDEYQNWIDDYVEAESESEAEELAKTWLKENGYEGDVDDLFVQVTEREYSQMSDEQFLKVLDSTPWYDDEMMKDLCRRTNLLTEYDDANAFIEDVLEKAYTKLLRKVNK